jgi:pimeloyl-ACP methyl ester carboxylesterase
MTTSERTRAGLLTALVLCLTPAAAPRGQQADAPLPPPGRLVDLGGWRMHLHCTGERRAADPIVILEAGAGDTSAEWALLQPTVSRFARVCSYDRSGSGWSDLGPFPHTARQVAFELRALLEAAGESSPYIMVGHSFGGRYVRVFASANPGSVRGMVLVDAGHEDNTLFVNGKAQRLWESATQQPIPEPRLAPPLRTSDLPPEVQRQLEAAARQANPQIDRPPYSKLPGEAREARRRTWSQVTHFAANNSTYEGDEALAARAERQRTPQPLGDMPLVVVTRGQAIANAEREAERVALQADLVTLSRRGAQVVAANSGHHIHIDEPAVVADAIRTVFDQATAPAPER